MKNLLNLGKALNRAEQKAIFGGDEIIHHCGDLLHEEPCCVKVMEYDEVNERWYFTEKCF